MKKLHPSNLSVSGCPCGSGRTYPACCAVYHQGTPAPTAEDLMRARYSAYVMHDDAFIGATWHPSTRPAMLDVDVALEPHPATRWLGLELRHQGESGVSSNTATVEFVARFKTGGRAQQLHEVSRFVREAGWWFYLDGSFTNDEKP